MDELSLWTRLSHKVEEETMMETAGMIVVVVTVVVTMAGEEALVVVTASNVASLVILLGNAHLVMGVEEIGTVAGMIDMVVVVGVVAVMEDLIGMGTVMVADEAGMAEVVVAQEVTDTAVTALDHMNAPVEVVEVTVDNWCSCCSHRELERNVQKFLVVVDLDAGFWQFTVL